MELAVSPVEFTEKLGNRADWEAGNQMDSGVSTY